MDRRRFLLAGAALAATTTGGGAATLAQQGSADAWPARPVTVLVPFVAGGPSDIVARAITTRMQQAIGQPVVAENRPGANGEVAGRLLARAAPDGHTLMVGSIGVYAINAALRPNLGYDPVRDFTPVTLAVTTPNVLITKPTLAAGSLKELVDHMKKNPGKLSYCSSGTGSSDHLTAELLKQATGTDAVHVPYKGGAACQTDIMGNQVDFSFQNLGAVTNYIKGKRMKALAVTAKARHPQLPDVPSAAPAKTPKESVARLNGAMVKALRSPDIAERMNQIGFDVVASTPEEFGAFMKAEVERWTSVVAKGNIKPE
jgi:tripartite-type tricarboxylate transporter receptor subunit TctC